MNILDNRTTCAVVMLFGLVLLFPVTARSEIPSPGGVEMGYSCTDSTITDDNGKILSGTKSCKCTGGKYSADCRKMIENEECAVVSHPSDDGLVCTDEACFCTKKISVDTDRFGVGRLGRATSTTLVLDEPAGDRKNEKVSARRGTAPVSAEAAADRNESKTETRKVRDQRDK